MIQSLVLLICCAFAQNPISVLVEDVNGVTHLEFSGRDNWNYSAKKGSNNTLTMEVEPVDAKSEALLKNLHSPLIDHVELDDGVNLKQKITFFLKGKNAQGFDYITDQPSRLVMDFYLDDQAKSNHENIAQKGHSKQKITKLPFKKNRAPASTDFALQPQFDKIEETVLPTNLDGADPDYSRFQIADYEIKDSAIIASKLNLYIHYPMMEVPEANLRAILQSPNTYELKPENSDENKKAQLLFTLFNKGRKDLDTPNKLSVEKPRYAVFLKALELFREEYPDSNYNEQLSNMEADTYYNLWLDQHNNKDFETAINLYSKILLSKKNSQWQDRTMRLVAFSYFNQGAYLNAFTMFQKYINTYSDSPAHYPVRMAMAECLAKLNNTDDALKIYNEIETGKNAGNFAVEAAFRKGDIYAQIHQYERAIAQYSAAEKEYPQLAAQYPNAVYNTAESRFWMNKERTNLKQSLDTYIDFLKKYPKNEHASYAMERIGELLEILGAPEKRFNGAFIETIYRYGDTQAAGIAKIRLLRARIPDMKEKETDDEIAHINEFIKTSHLEKLKEFKTIMIADGYYEKKDYDSALKYLIGFYQQNPLSDYLDVFKKRIVQTFRDQMAYSVEQKDYLKTFQIYGKNASVWFADSGRVDIEYLLGRAFEEAAVPDQAIEKYQMVLNKLYSIRGTQEERERKVFEALPSVDQVNLRLASEYVFKGEFGKALEHLKEIKEDNLSLDEKVEKVSLASQVYEKLDKPELAINNLRSLTNSWRGEPEKLSPVYLSLAKLEDEHGHSAVALATLDQLLNMSKDSQIISEDDQMTALSLKAKICKDLKKPQDAIDAYKKLLDNFEEKHPLYAARYELGMIYFEKGEIKEAEKTWSALQDKPDAQIWSKLAQENLKNANWTDEYKKYTTRIPAMANDSQKEGDRK